MTDVDRLPTRAGRVPVTGAPEGCDALFVAELSRPVLFVARDDVRLARMAEALAFFAPDVERLEFPAWDCLPYDRASPHGDIVARRIDTLARLPHPAATGRRRVVLTTIAALLQRVPPRDLFVGTALEIRPGRRLDPADLLAFLEHNGYGRAETVMEPGEYAVRGGIVDVYPTGADLPLRLDFFGDELEGLRPFDPTTQRTAGTADSLVLRPVSEVLLDDAAVSRFRSGYRDLFGVTGAGDPLYESVSAGRRHLGMEHWLPLFHDHLETLFDYVGDMQVVLDHEAGPAGEARLELIAEYYQARREVTATSLAAAGGPYHPVPPERLYLDADELARRLADYPVVALSPFSAPDAVDAGGRPGRDFADARVDPNINVFDAVRAHIVSLRGQGRRVAVAAFSNGARERLGALLREHGLGPLAAVETWTEAQALEPNTVALVVLGLERGFTTAGLAVVAEQDILGERLVRPTRRRTRPENFIAEAAALEEGDLVVHVDHGIGRFDGLVTLDVAGAPHDCLRILYDGGDKLFLPVENIEVLSRYGSEEAGAQLDRLGGAAWQARKARMKQRIRDMADQLIKVAAVRALRPGLMIVPPEGAFDEFCARFPYTETEDQGRAIVETLDGLASGKASDRLVCGDVGFGKTEVALRAAFATALSGAQVAVVVPTTLLCRQHFRSFRERFTGFPVVIGQLSRLVGPKTTREVKQGLKDGTVDVVVGTHALLSKSIAFRDLGLLIVDEEQHFGVAHKERLKSLKADVHVLTLTATPIPRTLQMALTGVKEMSIIATPPVDRLAVRTFVLPYDPVVLREAIQRERFRGGQVFYVCPRVKDLEGVAKELAALVPDARVVTVHGQLAAKDLEDRIGAFNDRHYDILLSTNIIESGLDMPSVNTIVIHRADMFGLAQLYQLRGRVGRSKARAYAYLTLPPARTLTAAARKRLEVMQTLDSLGAGFTLASHDLDIRGAGNLLGEEQSGHIREVGIELYQQMLEEAVAEARGAADAYAHAAEQEWSPQIGLGMPVLIPETYVADLSVRMGLYRRLARLSGAEEIEPFAAELIDRFGSLPAEVENLLETVAIKRLCRDAGVDRIDAGPKGAVVGFRNDSPPNPDGLVHFLTRQVGTAKVRPDQKLVFMRAWDDARARLIGAKRLLTDLAAVATEGGSP